MALHEPAHTVRLTTIGHLLYVAGVGEGGQPFRVVVPLESAVSDLVACTRAAFKPDAIPHEGPIE